MTTSPRYAFVGLQGGRYAVLHGYHGYPMSRQFVTFGGENAANRAVAWAEWWITGTMPLDKNGELF